MWDSNSRYNYSDIVRFIKSGEKVRIRPATVSLLRKQREKLKQVIKRREKIYSVTTGLGALKDSFISSKDTKKFQKNLIRSHAVGVGDFFPEYIVQTIILLMIGYLSKGYSGVRPKTLMALTEIFNKKVIPLVPEKGSVGASGDLVPSAHIGLVLLGRGEAVYQGNRMPGKKALAKAGIKPVHLEAKEGLALINNTSTMTANAIWALNEAAYLSNIADLAGALSAEALLATNKAFDEKIHQLKPYQNQLLVARRLRELRKKSTLEDESRIQDQYSIRCIPQVHGAVREAVDFAEKIVNTEINSVTDNPLIFSEKDGSLSVLSGGNFHGEAVAIAMDTLRLAICELGNIADRRVFSLNDKNHSFGLPPFLMENSGLNSGMMIVQYTTAALVSENKILAHPAVVDSIPTSAGIEDIVSMGTISSRKTLEVLDNVKQVLAIELLVACQAVDFRLQGGYKLGQGTEKAYQKIRQVVPFFESDHEYYLFVKEIIRLIDERKL